LTITPIATSRATNDEQSSKERIVIPVATVMACPHLATPAALMVHVAQVESHMNPFAIGVVGGRLARQPDNLAEAIATARMLEANGYNFSVGIAQVNRSNFGQYGLDTYQKAFSICGNLLAGSRILAGCHASAHGAWDKAFSCYNSGNYTTGFSNGYVQKILATFDRGLAVAKADPSSSRIIPLVPASPAAGTATASRNSAAYRIALRSSMPDAAASALVVPAITALSHQPAPSTVPDPQRRRSAQTAIASAAEGQPAAAVEGKVQPTTIFEPRVTGPGDAPQQAPPARSMQTNVHQLSAQARDGAFVF
jgi:type IV secretion system protein VirB1